MFRIDRPVEDVRDALEEFFEVEGATKVEVRNGAVLGLVPPEGRVRAETLLRAELAFGPSEDRSGPVVYLSLTGSYNMRSYSHWIQHGTSQPPVVKKLKTGLQSRFGPDIERLESPDWSDTGADSDGGDDGGHPYA